MEESSSAKHKKTSTPSLHELRKKKLDSGNRVEAHAVTKGNFIIQTEKSKLSAAAIYVLDNKDYLSANTGSFLNFIEKSENVKLRFFETTDGPNEYGETALWVENPDGTWGNLDADQNVQWNNIHSKSHFELRISLNGKHNYGDTAVNYQTVLHELIVHGLPYYKILQTLIHDKPDPKVFKKYWDSQTQTGFNNGELQHYEYGKGRLADYNKSIEGLSKRLQYKEEFQNPTKKVGYGDSSTRQLSTFFVYPENEKHISTRLKKESEKDIQSHKAMFPAPPLGRYSSSRIN